MAPNGCERECERERERKRETKTRKLAGGKRQVRISSLCSFDVKGLGEDVGCCVSVCVCVCKRVCIFVWLKGTDPFNLLLLVHMNLNERGVVICLHASDSGLRGSLSEADFISVCLASGSNLISPRHPAHQCAVTIRT